MKKNRQILTLYEYDRLDFKSSISHQTSATLNKVMEGLSKHVKGRVLERVLNSRNETVGIRAFQYVGVIRIDDSLTIEILPKMYRQADAQIDNEKSINIDNLFFMLDYCGQVNIPHSDSTQLHKTKGSFFETLIYLFASDLLNCIQNAAHHEYVAKEDNLPYLRGKLLLNKHITLNSINKSRFYLQSDMFTADNDLNRIFKYVSKMLLGATKNSRNKNILLQILSIFDEVTDTRITSRNAERITLTRLNIRFEQSLKLSKLFLASQSVQLSASNYDSFTFLIDMNRLFEEFISSALRKILKRSKNTEITIKKQGPIKTFVEYTQYDQKGIFRMKPDITILRSKVVSAIIDTKYKILQDDRKLGVSQPDLYQMYAYANKYKTSDITLLYPEKPNDFDFLRETDFYIDESCTVKVRTINLGYRLSFDRARSVEKRLYELIMANVEVPLGL